MDVKLFLEAISKVTNPLTLIAFIVVVILAALIVVLKATGGLAKAQELIIPSLQPGEFRKIVNTVLYTLVAIAAMLFVLLAYNLHVDAEGDKPPLGTVCYGGTCTGKDPRDTGCDDGATTLTSTTASFPEFGDNFKNLRVELRHSAKCNASWAKAPAPVGSRVYIEGDSKEYASTPIQDNGITDPHYTDMAPGDVRRRACVQAPNGKVSCTSYID